MSSMGPFSDHCRYVSLITSNRRPEIRRRVFVIPSKLIDATSVGLPLPGAITRTVSSVTE